MINNNFSIRTLNILKASLPFMPSGMQRYISNFVKIEEFNHMFMNLNNSLDSTISACDLSEDTTRPFNTSDFICAVKPYLNKSEQELLNMFINMTNAFNIYNMYQHLPPSATADNDSENKNQTSDNDSKTGFQNGINIDALKSLLTPEQKSMFDKYSTMLNNTANLAN